MSQPAANPVNGSAPRAPGSAPAAPASGGDPDSWHSSPLKPVVTAARLVSFTLVCGLLYWAKAVAIPLALAVLVSFMLHPFAKRLQRIGLPLVVAVSTSVLLACSAVIALTWGIGGQLASLSQDLPKYEDNIAAKIKDVRSWWRGGAMEKIQDAMENMAQELNSDAADVKPVADPQAQRDSTKKREEPVAVVVTTSQKLVDLEKLSALLPVIDPIVTAGLVLLLVILMLLRWEDMRSRLISFSGHKNLTVATKACDDAGRRIGRYLMMQFIVNSSYGVAIGVGLYLLGVPYAPLWALCAGLFRYVPYAGPIVAAFLPIVFSFITSEGWTQPLWVAGFVVVLELVSNNLIEPWLYGSNLGLSAMGVVMSAVAWTSLWGPVGLVMATPLTVVLVVLGEYVPAFAIFTRLFGDKPVMDPHFQFYQRLLAHDETEATDLARGFVKENGLHESSDRLFVPALALAKRDDMAGLLEGDDAQYVNTTAERVFNLFRDEADGEAAEENGSASPAGMMERTPIIVWPVNEFAATAVKLLQWILRDTSAEVMVMPPQALVSEVSQKVREVKPGAVCLLNLAGSDVARTRQYARRLRADSPGTPLIVARLGIPGTLAADVRDALKDAGAVSVTRTLTETGAALVPYANDTARMLPDAGA